MITNTIVLFYKNGVWENVKKVVRVLFYPNVLTPKVPNNGLELQHIKLRTRLTYFLLKCSFYFQEEYNLTQLYSVLNHILKYVKKQERHLRTVHGE